MVKIHFTRYYHSLKTDILTWLHRIWNGVDLKLTQSHLYYFSNLISKSIYEINIY